MRLRAIIIGTFVGLGLIGCQPTSEIAGKTAKISQPDAIPHGMLGDNVIPTAYRLDLVINPDDEGFSGLAEIDVNVESPTSKIWLHGKTLTVTGAIARLADGTEIPLSYTELSAEVAPSGIAHLTAGAEIPAGVATLVLPYETPFNLNLNSAYKVERDDEAYIVTQFEAIGAREAFPGFDEPRFKVPFKLSITAPDEDFVYANTAEIAQKTDGAGWTHYQFATTRPLPTYLIAFGVGPYDVVKYDDLPATDVRARPIPLRGIAAKGSGTKFDYALKNTAGILEAIESYFGIPYPYEKLDLIAAPDYAFGAMENPGAIVYREYLLLLDDDAPLSQKRSYAGVHSHELAHQWFGNLVTPFWWEDIWLNEAFATWMGNKGTSLWQPEGNFDRNTLKAALGAMNLDTLATTRKVREPLTRTEDVMHQFDSITYRKGGGVLSMFESYLGEEAFQKGVRLHMERFADDVATADDFFQSLADGSGDPNVVPALKSFVDQPGLPLVRGEFTCAKSKGSQVRLTQSRYAPLGSKTEQRQIWQIPVCAEFGHADGPEKVCALMKDKAETLKSSRPNSCAKYVTLNKNGSGYYRFSLDDFGWAALLENLDGLNTREVLTVQDSLLAAYRAGEVESSVYLKGVDAFAQHAEYDVVSKAGDLLAWMDAQMPDDARVDYQRFVQDIYKERFEAIVGTDTIEGKLLAPSLLSNLIYYAKDKELIDLYAAKGAAYLGLDALPEKEAVASNLLASALAAAMKRRDTESFDAILNLASSGSPLEKRAALSALSDVTSPELAARLRSIALDQSGPLTGRQSTSVIFGLLNHPDHVVTTWQWLKDNFEDYVTNRVPSVRVSAMPSYAGVFCSDPRREEAETFFTENAALIPGYEHRLAQTLESIELCTALKTQKSEELAKALKQH